MSALPRTVGATLAALAVAAGAAASATHGAAPTPYVPPSSGTAQGVDWTTVDLGTCSVASNTATVSGTYVGCPSTSVASPGAVASAFGSLWAAGSGAYVQGQATAYVQAVNPSTSAVSPVQSISGITLPKAAVLGGSYLWLAGASAASSNGSVKAVAVGLDSTGTARKRFTASSGSTGGGGLSVAYGASKVWVGDALGRVYGLSPSSGKLLLTIKTPSPHGLAVSGSNLWVTNPSARTVRVFNTSSGAQRTSITVTGAPNAVLVSGSSAWVFTQKYLYRYSTSSLKQTGRYTAPQSGSGWLRAVSGPGGIWASNYVAQVVRFNTSALAFDVNATWSNSNTAGPIASAGGALWVPNTGSSPSPVGHSVTRFVPTS